MELFEIINKSPNAFANSLLTVPMRIISFILFVGLLFSGISFLWFKEAQFWFLDAVVADKAIDLSATVKEQIIKLNRIIGWLLIFLSLFMLLINLLTIQITRRNQFILEIGAWYDNEVEKQQKAQEASKNQKK